MWPEPRRGADVADRSVDGASAWRGNRAVQGFRLAALYLLAGVVLAIVVLVLLGWRGVRAPGVLVVNTTVAAAVGGALLLAEQRRWPVPLQLQNAIGVVSLVLISVASYAIGGIEGAVFACSYANVAAITAMYYPLRVVVAVEALTAVLYAIVVVASGGTIVQWALVMGVAGASGFLAGGHSRHVRRLATELHGMEEWRATLMSALAHDLRSPLGTAQSTVDLLLGRDGELDDDQRRQLLGGIRRQLRRANHLTHDLLDHERAQAGQLTVDLQPIDLAAVLGTATRYVTEDVVLDVPAGLEVLADAPRLEQVVVNLVTNAMKYGRPPIQIGARPEDDVVRCWVRDHGPGIAPEAHDDIFGRFGAGGATSDSVGLGLWIVATLVDAHGGEVSYEDARPGARFVWTLRAAPGTS